MALPATIEAPVALAVLLAALYYAWRENSKSRDLPPGPSPLPFLGNIHQLPLQYQHKRFADWAKKHGEVFYIRLFQKPVFVIGSARAAQELLEKKASKYADRPQFIWLDKIVQFKPIIPFMRYDDDFRRHRKWFQGFLETKSALNAYRDIQRRETGTFLALLVHTPDAFISHIKRYTGAVMLEIAYGRSVTSVEDEYIRFTDRTITKFVEAGSLVATLVDFFPILQYIPSWMPGGGFKKQALEVRHMVQRMMNDPFIRVKEEMASGTAKPSFTTFMIEEMSQGGVAAMTPEIEADIKGAASVMYASSDTTHTALLTFVLMMVLHPEVCRKAQAEIDRVLGNERFPDLEDRESLPYLECILKELYRFNPPLPLGKC